jgi:hypothetical protein
VRWSGVNDKLWVRVGFKQGPLPSLADTLLTTGTGGIGSYRDDAIFGASNPANIPYGLISYKTLNPWARNWIAQYTLALCKELLGNIRGKFKSIPFGDKEVTLNGEDLVSQAREDKEKLMTGLKEKLESLTFDKLAEMEATRAEMMVKQLGFIPVPPSVAISMR